MLQHSCEAVSEVGESWNIDMTDEVEKEPLQRSTSYQDREEPGEGGEETQEWYAVLSGFHLAGSDTDFEIVEYLRSKAAATKPPSHLFQALGIQFAIPSLVLFVVPETSGALQMMEEFRELGVEADAVKLAELAKGRTDLQPSPAEETNDPEQKCSSETPRLLISNLANIRGLDLPSLMHVFVLCTDTIKTQSDYTHIAGRVRRLSKKGHVIRHLEQMKAG
ncbi:hypothetical protein FS837_006086 [Tulasnella sp. UAMH 9824]|nr:hypothetical protein FS837_006086 [Tulasnella sp. UAMH 9824]